MKDKLIRIQSELKCPKNQTNKFGGYKYRSLEDILDAVKPLLVREGLCLTISEEVVEIAGIPVINVEAVLTDTEGQPGMISTASAGVDIHKKGMDIAQSFGSSSSYARKYALNGLFLIDDTKDSDATNTHGYEKTSPVKKKLVLKKDTENFAKAVQYMKSPGANIDIIKKKYDLAEGVEEALVK